MRAAPALMALLLFALAPGAARGQACTLPDAVALTLPDSAPSHDFYTTIRDQGVPFDELDLGIGHLHPTQATWDWPWLPKIALPLSETRGAPPWGWIAGGWLVDTRNGEVSPFGLEGLLETGYEEATFIVLQRPLDGWVEIRHAPGSAESGSGTAWIPECALEGETIHLEVQSWQDRLLSDVISPLFFRSNVPHVLREIPRVDGAHLGTISGDYHLEPQEISGDWMRVVVKEPSDSCRSDVESTTRTGWVKWRSDDKGPWVWYHTRGC